MPPVAKLRSAPNGNGTFTGANWANSNVAGSWSAEWEITGIEPGKTAIEIHHRLVGTGLVGYPGMLMPGNPMWCIGSIAVRHTDASAVWYATVTYEPNPLLLPVEIHRYSTHYSKVLTEDYSTPNRKPVVNSAKQPFKPAMEQTCSRQRFEVVRRWTAAKASQFDPDELVDHTNSTPFMGKSRHTLVCSDYREVPVMQPMPHVLCTFIFEYDKNTWKRRVLDEGSKTLDSNTGKPAWIKDKDGLPGGTWLLDGYGQRLTGTSMVPVYREFEPYPECDFNRFGIFENCAPLGPGKAPHGFLAIQSSNYP
jgi:hypothetical protein